MSKFRTLKVSDSRFSPKSLQFLTVKSEHLRGRGDICVWAPDIKEVYDLPIVILLHGVYGSAWSWALNAGAHITAKRMIEQSRIRPIILAMPSDGLWGDGSGYLKLGSQDFENWIVEDVPNAVGEVMPAAKNSRDLFICGLSMGGFGAMRIGVKYGHMFKGISAHSAITSLEQMKLFVEEDLDLYRQLNAEDEDVFLTIQKYKNQLPPLRFDCGRDDLLIERNRKLHKDLTQAGVGHVYQEFEGVHEWPYWEQHFEDSLEFFDGILQKGGD